MKRCCRCKKEKLLWHFATDRSSKDGKQSRCKKCCQVYARKQYEQKRDYCIEKSSRRVYYILAENQEKSRQYKSEIGCKYCSENDPVALDFHHKFGDKEYTISSKMSTLRWTQLLIEIAKCDVLCSNCHRKFHAGRKLIARKMD